MLNDPVGSPGDTAGAHDGGMTTSIPPGATPPAATPPPRPIGTITTLAIYPERDEPGTRLESAFVEPAGLEGDRRKKRPVHVVGQEETPDTTRANLFLDTPDARLREALGQEVRAGGVVLALDELPSGCAGVYASVVQDGLLAVGDPLETLEPGVDTGEHSGVDAPA